MPTRSAARRLVVAAVALFAVALAWPLVAQGPEPAKGVKYANVSESDLREWLTYLSSDALQGRQIFTEGYGLAAAYVADHLRQWGVKPLGENGSYFQDVKLRGYKVTINSSVTVEAHGETRTFKQGDHVTFSVTSGGRQTRTFTGAEFVGYGIASPDAGYDDYKGRDVKDRLIITVLGAPVDLVQPAGAAGRGTGRGAPGGRGPAYAFGTLGAAASITFFPAPPPPTPAEEAVARAQAAVAQANDALVQAQQALAQGQRGGGGRGAPAAARGGAARGATARGGAQTAADLTTVQQVDGIVPPQVIADETFFEFLLGGSGVTVENLKTAAAKGGRLPAIPLNDVKVTINIDNTFEVVSQQLSKNVVGMIEGSDPKLKDTYVMFGAHLDHIGYRTTAAGRAGGPPGCRRTIDPLTPLPGRAAPAPPPAAAAAVPFDAQDLINNGADDDGSGSASELGIAKAFATGPKPRRSVVFMWHTGEEAGLYGSRYNADHPIVPLDRVQAQLNIDMIGRDDCDDLYGDYSNSVFVVGADRISTDLHNLIVDTDAAMPRPLALDFEMNDPRDPESIYTRSDHYSYASKGIPIAFFTTGLHPDYHRVSDSVDKILFPKMTRIAQLVYEAGFSIADTDRPLERDNRGPRAGKGFQGRLK